MDCLVDTMCVTTHIMCKPQSSSKECSIMFKSPSLFILFILFILRILSLFLCTARILLRSYPDACLCDYASKQTLPAGE